jgi:hypothetical protein
MGHRITSCDPHLHPSHQATNALPPHAKRPPPGGYVQTGKPPKSYKKECQEKNLPFGSMPVDFLSRHSAQLPERALLL